METSSPQSIPGRGLSRRNFLKAGIFGIVGVVGIGALGTGCSSTSPQPGQGGGAPSSKSLKSVVVAWGLDPRTLDPAIGDTRVEQNINTHVYDSLLALGPQGKIMPALAESWSNVSANTWRFNLRKGVKFHNSDPFTAEAVKYSYDRIFDSAVKSTLQGYYRWFDKATVVDDYTVDITLKTPSPLFLKYIANYGFVVSPKYISGKGIEAAAINPVGTGAFRFVEWVKGDHITLEANKEYWGGGANFDSLSFKTLPQPASRTAALRTGEVDIVIDLDPAASKELQGVGGLKVASVPGYRNIYLLVDHRADTPLKKREVRWALNYAVDKEALVKNVLEGNGTVLEGQPYSPMYFGYNPSLKRIPYDPDRARKMLADAGYPNGFEIEFVTPFGRYLKDKELTEAVAGQLEKVGVRAKIQVVEWANYMQKFLGKTNGPLAMTGQAAPSVDALEHFTIYWWSKGAVSHYDNPAFDAIVDKASVEMDEKRREQLLQDGVKMLNDDAANIWLHQQHDLYGFRDRIQGWTPPSDQWVDLRKISVS